MPEEERNGFRVRGDVGIGELLTVLAIVGGVIVFYFGGQGSLIERVNHAETSMADRIGKLETRVAVGEQHQLQTDGAVQDTRAQLNSFIAEVRTDLAKISDKIDELRPLLVNRGAPDGAHR